MSDQISLSIQPQAVAPVAQIGSASGSGNWMTLQDAADATGISPQTLRRYIKRRTIKYRRLGRSINSKLEVLVTPDLLLGTDRINTSGLEEVLNHPIEQLDQIDDLDDQADEYSDQSTSETLSWFRERIDYKDAKIEALTKELMSANFRNGYLQSQVQGFEEQVKLLTDNQNKKPGWWTKLRSKLSGR